MTWFSYHFWPFLVIFARWGFFPKNSTLSHKIKYGSLTPCKVSEKTNDLILGKLTEKGKDGRTDPTLQDPSGRGQGFKNLFIWRMVGTWRDIGISFFRRPFFHTARVNSRGFFLHRKVNHLMSDGNKRSYVFKQTSSFKLQACLSTYALLLAAGIKGE